MKTPAATKATTSAPNKSDSQAKPSTKSTATEAQYETIIHLLRIAPRNTYELRRHGVMAPAARILELNRFHGFEIVRVNRVSITDSDGFTHSGVALYELVTEPDGWGCGK